MKYYYVLCYVKVAVCWAFFCNSNSNEIFSRSRRREFKNPVGSGFHNFSIDLPLILWIIEIFQQRPQIYRTPCKSITIRRSLCIGWCRKPYGIRHCFHNFYVEITDCFSVYIGCPDCYRICTEFFFVKRICFSVPTISPSRTHSILKFSRSSC